MGQGEGGFPSGDSSGTVGSVVDILEAELPEQITDDADHGVVVVDDQNRHREVHGHSWLSVELPLAPGIVGAMWAATCPSFRAWTLTASD